MRPSNQSVRVRAHRESTCIVFIVLYALCTLLHASQAKYYRMWWPLPTFVLVGVCETAGWSARLWSNRDPLSISAYEMQLVLTVLAPTFLVAGIFTILGMIIRRLGSQYSRLSPKYYLIFFCTSDVLSLVIQSVGGASAAASVATGGDALTGGRIILGGVAFQMFTIICYVVFELEFLARYFLDKPVRRNNVDEKSWRTPLDTRMKIMISALLLSTVCIFIRINRMVYRTVELSDGWTGRIITTQVYFNFCDGIMITIAMWAINLAHPGLLIRGSSEDKNRKSSDATVVSPVPA